MKPNIPQSATGSEVVFNSFTGQIKDSKLEDLDKIKPTKKPKIKK